MRSLRSLRSSDLNSTRYGRTQYERNRLVFDYCVHVIGGLVKEGFILDTSFEHMLNMT